MPCDDFDSAWHHVAAEQRKRDIAVMRGWRLIGKILAVVIVSTSIAAIVVVIMRSV